MHILSHINYLDVWGVVVGFQTLQPEELLNTAGGMSSKEEGERSAARSNAVEANRIAATEIIRTGLCRVAIPFAVRDHLSIHR
jgi:hypothetical protein